MLSTRRANLVAAAACRHLLPCRQAMASPASSPPDLLDSLQSLLDAENINTRPAAVPTKAHSRARSDTESLLLSSASGPLDESELATRTQELTVHESELEDETMSQMSVDSESPAPFPEAETAGSNAQVLQNCEDPRTMNTGEFTGSSVPLLTMEEWDALYPCKYNGPVPLAPKSTNPDAIPRFNHLCQVHSLTSSFTFEEKEKGSFSSKVRFGEYVCEAPGPFSNKRLAKEAVAESALGTLENIKLPSKTEKGRPRKRTLTERDDDSSSDEVNENWVAILHEFVQKHHHSQPKFQYAQHSTYLEQKMGNATSSHGYSCSLSIEARPDYTFGSATKHYPSKADAKRLAAKDAVIWLRTVGRLPEQADETSTKRRKSATDEAHTGVSQETSRVSLNQSPAQLVASLSLRLKLSPPSFDLQPVKQNYYVCTARYLEQDVQKQPKLAGSLSRTPEIHGQKNAKAMCCQDLAILLESLVAGRDQTQ